MRTIALRLGLLGALGIGGAVLSPYLMGSAADLAVGDCFDPPAQLVEVEEVQRHPCTEAHGAEVFYVADYPAADGAGYPGDPAFEAHVRDVCVRAFDAYTGLDFQTDPTWTFGYFTPTDEGWSMGDHEISCYAERMDGATTSASIRAAS